MTIYWLQIKPVVKTKEQYLTSGIFFNYLHYGDEFLVIAIQEVTFLPVVVSVSRNAQTTRMWANAQPDGRPAKHRWRPLFNAAKFG